MQTHTNIRGKLQMGPQRKDQGRKEDKDETEQLLVTTEKEKEEEDRRRVAALFEQAKTACVRALEVLKKILSFPDVEESKSISTAQAQEPLDKIYLEINSLFDQCFIHAQSKGEPFRHDLSDITENIRNSKFLEAAIGLFELIAKFLYEQRQYQSEEKGKPISGNKLKNMVYQVCRVVVLQIISNLAVHAQKAIPSAPDRIVPLQCLYNSILSRHFESDYNIKDSDFHELVDDISTNLQHESFGHRDYFSAIIMCGRPTRSQSINCSMLEAVENLCEATKSAIGDIDINDLIKNLKELQDARKRSWEETEVSSCLKKVELSQFSQLSLQFITQIAVFWPEKYTQLQQRQQQEEESKSETCPAMTSFTPRGP